MKKAAHKDGEKDRLWCWRNRFCIFTKPVSTFAKTGLARQTKPVSDQSETGFTVKPKPVSAKTGFTETGFAETGFGQLVSKTGSLTGSRFGLRPSC